MNIDHRIYLCEAGVHRYLFAKGPLFVQNILVCSDKIIHHNLVQDKWFSLTHASNVQDCETVMPVSSKGIFIIGAKRTPFCQYGGPLRELPACHAFAAAAKDAIQCAKLDPALIDHTIVGNMNYLSQCDGGKTPRYCGLYSGVPIEKPSLGVSKACGTGLQAIITSATDILFGTSKITLTGGTDISSSLPMLVRNVRFGTALGTPYMFEDHIQRELMDSYSKLTLTQIAEGVAKKYGIDRKEVDEFALDSHLKWKTAQNSSIFADEITNLTVTVDKKEIVVEKDQLPLPTLNLDQIQKISSFEDGGVITGGKSATVADGAAALLLASEDATIDHNLTPLVKLTAWSCVGVDPAETGQAAAVAIRKLLDERSLDVEDIDLFEINETFAAQVLSTAMSLHIDLSRVNVNGGALAIGNPVSATGARMATNLVYELRRRNAHRAIAASSCGAGQGVALMLETL